MKLKYKFIEFNPTKSEFHGCNAWMCTNKKTGFQLGIVDYFPKWKQHCFFPTEPAVYSAGCLNDISDFIGQIKRNAQ